jgi:hypothetical protein
MLGYREREASRAAAACLHRAAPVLGRVKGDPAAAAMAEAAMAVEAMAASETAAVRA